MKRTFVLVALAALLVLGMVGVASAAGLGYGVYSTTKAVPGHAKCAVQKPDTFVTGFWPTLSAAKTVANSLNARTPAFMCGGFVAKAWS